MPSVFKIYISGISDPNMVWRSDQVSEMSGYGDSILSPKLKKEINKADGFDFMILPSNSFYNSFKKKNTFVFVTRDDKCIFRGRVSDVKTDIFKQRTITCEGDLAFLADSVQSPNRRTNTSQDGSTGKQERNTLYYGFDGSSSTSDDIIKMSVESYFRGLIGEHNAQMSGYTKGFTVGTVTVNNRNKVEKFERTSFQDTSSVISSDLLSVYGGVLRTRFESNTAYIDWLDDYTTTSGQDIRFGVNLIEMDQESPSDGIWSVLLPVGDDNLTIEDVNGSMYLSTTELLNTYDYIIHCHQFNDVKNATELLAKARQYLDIHGKIFPDNIIVKAIDLQLIGESNDPLELGEKIKVVSEPHGLDKTMSCIAMELDIFNPENNSYTIGEIMPPDKEKKKDSLSSQQASLSSSSSRGIRNNANKIAQMSEDINVHANNINVNAENIAVNTTNIGINATNIGINTTNITANTEAILLRVEKDGVIASINASPEEIGIKAERIVLEGEVVLTDHLTATYATIENLNTTNGNFTNLISGVTEADKLWSKVMAVTRSIEIGNRYVDASLSYRGYEYYPVSVTMPNVDSVIVLGRTTSGYSSVPLAHSHSVSTGSDGTITLGGTVATDASNRSFRIADTKTYQDGVSAAFDRGVDSVTVDSLGLNTSSYSSYYRRYQISVTATASNEHSKTGTIYVDASNAYNDGESDGWNAVTVSDVVYKSSTISGDKMDVKFQIILENGYSINWTITDISTK